jgi:hypothetical protein
MNGQFPKSFTPEEGDITERKSEVYVQPVEKFQQAFFMIQE